MDEPSDRRVEFDRLVREHYAMVVSFSATLLGHRGEAEDLAQDVFVVAHRKQNEFDASRPAGPWLRGIARNLARNAIRRARSVLYLDEDALEWLESIYARIEQRPGPSWHERLDALAECLRRLDDVDTRYIALHYRNGRSYREISQSMQTSIENVKKRLYRIRRRLADCVLGRLEVSDARS